MSHNFTINEHNKKEDYQSDFDRIAKVLLNEKELVTQENFYRIREIEFYYYSAKHTDLYCHRNDRQLKNNSLYFHRFKDPEKYVRLKQKGIDITRGNGKTIYGGILIRAIENTKTNEIFTGIGKLTNRVISDIGSTFVIQDIYNADKSIFDSSALIYLKPVEGNGLRIFKKRRQGLNLKKDDTGGFYLDSKYNYFTYPVIEELK